MSKANFMLSDDWKDMVVNLPDELAGQLMKAVFLYHSGEDFSIDDPVLNAVFVMIKEYIDENDRKYEDTCRKRSDAAKAKASNSKQMQANANTSKQMLANASYSQQMPPDNDNDIDIKEKDVSKDTSKKKARFEKPTLEEVRAYCLERQNGIDAERFVDYYESQGWKVGKNPMKDWKACVRSWEKNAKERNNKGIKPKGNAFNNFDQRKYDFAALEHKLLNTQRARDG